MHTCYWAVIIAAIAILLLGAWNPPCFQTKVNGAPNGQPSYMWLALVALLVGSVSCYVMKMPADSYSLY